MRFIFGLLLLPVLLWTLPAKADHHSDVTKFASALHNLAAENGDERAFGKVRSLFRLAQVPMTGAGLGAPSSGGGGFSGPCDAVAGATGAYGFVSCSAAYASAHSAAADICDQATCTTTATINFLSTGYWDAATAAASASCTVACVVTKFYNSSGGTGGDAPANSNRNGLITFNVLGTCSGIAASATYANSPDYRSSVFTAVVQPYSYVALAKRGSGFTTSQGIIGSATGTFVEMGFHNVANTVKMNAGSADITLAGVADSAFHAIIGIGNGASSSINADGATTTASAGTASTTQIIMGTDVFAEPLLTGGEIVFGGLWPSSINVATMNTKIHSLCGGF